MNYQQAYDKIIQAYFNDEIQPMNARFCFCGTLHGGMEWTSVINKNKPYSYAEYGRMEKALFSAFPFIVWESNGDVLDTNDALITETPNYEERLFAGMSAALDVLKEIHRSRGEDVDAITVPFTKRQLA